MLDYPLETHPLEPDAQLPSPELLKEKILIKNKKQHHHNHTKSQHSKFEQCVGSKDRQISKGKTPNLSHESGKFDSWSLVRQAVKNSDTIALLKSLSSSKG